jgi:hypothetical protein
MSSFDYIKIAQILSPSISLFTAGGIAALSYYSSPILRAIAQESSNSLSLHQLRSLFSSGSHIFPQAATASAALSAYLAYALPSHRMAYSLAAAATMGIAPFTTMIMLPSTNGPLIEMDEGAKRDPTSVQGKRNTDQLVDLLDSFEKLNAVRAVLTASGGLIGVWALLN